MMASLLTWTYNNNKSGPRTLPCGGHYIRVGKFGRRYSALKKSQTYRKRYPMTVLDLKVQLYKHLRILFKTLSSCKMILRFISPVNFSDCICTNNLMLHIYGCTGLFYNLKIVHTCQVKTSEFSVSWSNLNQTKVCETAVF